MPFSFKSSKYLEMPRSRCLSEAKASELRNKEKQKASFFLLGMTLVITPGTCEHDKDSTKLQKAHRMHLINGSRCYRYYANLLLLRTRIENGSDFPPPCIFTGNEHM